MIIIIIIIIILQFPSLTSHFNSIMSNYRTNSTQHRHNTYLFLKFHYFKCMFTFYGFASLPIAK
jgi:hypothetical protein